jgi:hypothetical protein
MPKQMYVGKKVVKLILANTAPEKRGTKPWDDEHIMVDDDMYAFFDRRRLPGETIGQAMERILLTLPRDGGTRRFK